MAVDDSFMWAMGEAGADHPDGSAGPGEPGHQGGQGGAAGAGGAGGAGGDAGRVLVLISNHDASENITVFSAGGLRRGSGPNGDTRGWGAWGPWWAKSCSSL
jgi:hypothetical protein